MSSKTIPNSLRLYYKKNWKSQWIDDKNNYANSLILDLNIRRYIFTLLHGLRHVKLIDIVIKKNFNNYLIFIYFNSRYKIRRPLYTEIENNLNNFFKKNYFSKNYKTNIFLYNITPKFFYKKIRGFYSVTNFCKKQFILKRLKQNLILITLIIFLRKPKMLSELIAYNVKRFSNHKRFMANLESVLKKLLIQFPFFSGFKVQMNGKLKGKGRSKSFLIQHGKMPLSTINSNIEYDYSEALTKFGLCSIKVWFFFK